MSTRVLALVLAVVVVGCVASPGAKAPERPTYQFVLVAPTDDLRGGEVRTLTWRATPNGQSDRYPAAARLCFGIFGAFSDVSALKSSPLPAAVCPMNAAGALFVSEVTEADVFSSAPLSQELRLPKDAAPGLYSFVQVIDWGGGNRMSGGSIVKVVAAP